MVPRLSATGQRMAHTHTNKQTDAHTYTQTNKQTNTRTQINEHTHRQTKTCTHLRLNHEISLVSHVQDEVEDVHFPLSINHFHHGLNGDVRPCSSHAGARGCKCAYLRQRDQRREQRGSDKQ